ncbi:MAG TPA: hypothetical protein VEY07_05510 [Thermoplasmata archaeon]|nr:hypothetical protein [Thermoplasmata archaeon]
MIVVCLVVAVSAIGVIYLLGFAGKPLANVSLSIDSTSSVVSVNSDSCPLPASASVGSSHACDLLVSNEDFGPGPVPSSVNHTLLSIYVIGAPMSTSFSGLPHALAPAGTSQWVNGTVSYPVDGGTYQAVLILCVDVLSNCPS